LGKLITGKIGRSIIIKSMNDGSTKVFYTFTKMYRSISIRDKNISFQLRENSIAIINDGQLLALIAEMPEAATDELVSAIKGEFHAQFSREFGVTDDSMVVEIWGHVFAERFANAVKAITSVKLVDELAEKICMHCEVINIGRKDHDNNRFVWDWLAGFKPIIAAMLFRRMK
jgi:hypothetical protein